VDFFVAVALQEFMWVTLSIRLRKEIMDCLFHKASHLDKGFLFSSGFMQVSAGLLDFFGFAGIKRVTPSVWLSHF
jgi:hypothetical protein